MKSTKLFLLFLVAGFMFKNAVAQVVPQLTTNASLNTVSANAGVVNLGSTLDLTVAVTNTGANPIQAQRVRVQISVPFAVGVQLATGSQNALSPNWIVTASNLSTGVLTICNNTDVIPAGATRFNIVKISATAIGTGSFSTGLAFGNGISCTAFGSLLGDVTGDNTSNGTPMNVIASTLPLTLTDFSATLKDCQPVLQWTTASEINTDRFEIERSNASATDWKSIGNVSASGYSSTKINYSFTDKDLNASSEKVSYRLKMIDKDGSYKYSKILPVLINCKTATILVYPNPVQDGKLYVSLAGTTGYVEATLLSASGQMILKNKINNGTNYLNVLNIADGIYVLNVKDANGFDKNVKVSIKH
jgi:uncharacterized repeat protein (TIGR01451 family)